MKKYFILSVITAALILYLSGCGTILLCGNGGSCADCDHIVGELMKGFLSLRPMDDATKRALTERYPEDDAKMAESL